MRDWRRKNRAKSLAIGRMSDRKRRLENPDKMREKRRKNRRKVAMNQPEKAREQYLRKYRSLRRRALDRLGSCCTCCGEARGTMLQIDHIHNDGYIERRSKKGGSSSIARKILESSDPKDKYQILCANCNHSKARNRGECQHVTEKKIIEASIDKSRMLV